MIVELPRIGRVLSLVAVSWACVTCGTAFGGVRPTTEEIQLSAVGQPDVYFAGSPSLVQRAPHGIGVVWQALRRDETETLGIRGRLFHDNLMAVGDEFLANPNLPPPLSSAAQPTAAFTDDGLWVAAWSLRQDDPDDEDNVVALRTEEPGEATAPDRVVNETRRFSQNRPMVATAAGSRWTLVWQNEEFSPSDLSVRFRQFDGANPVGQERAVTSNLSTVSREGIGIRNGDSVQLFWSGSTAGFDWGIFGGTLGAGGELAPTSLVERAGVNRYPAAAALPEGNVLLVWRSDDPAGRGGIRARIFDQHLKPLSSERSVWSDPTPGQFRDKRPHVSTSPSGEHALVVWVLGDDHENRPDHDIVAQLLTAEGQAEGPPFFVTEKPNGVNQTNPDVSFISDSTFVVVWESEPDPEHRSNVVVGRLFGIAATTPDCGDADGDRLVKASDALRTLRAAVGVGDCALCICDVDGSETVAAADALAVLRSSVGITTFVSCPAC